MKVAIASGKGGTGKTTLSINLSAFMAEQQELVLVDMDVEAPDTSIFFKGRFEEVIREKMIPEWNHEKCSLCGKCQEVCNFNAIIKLLDDIIVFPELCHSCHACAVLCPHHALNMKGKRMGISRISSHNKLTLIENRLDIGEEQAVPLIAQSLEELEPQQKDGKIIIMDAPPGTSCPLIEVSIDADLVVLVAEPTPFGLNDLKLAVETIKSLGRNLAVVINKDGIGTGELEQYCKERNLPVIAKIPYTRKAAEMYSAGHLLYQEIPVIKREIEKVAEYILKKEKEGWG